MGRSHTQGMLSTFPPRSGEAALPGELARVFLTVSIETVAFVAPYTTKALCDS